eukprot:6658397-Alexandrium_andersonii.AAC.1
MPSMMAFLTNLSMRRTHASRPSGISWSLGMPATSCSIMRAVASVHGRGCATALMMGLPGTAPKGPSAAG